MWKLTKHVTHIPLRNQMINDEDAKKIIFPLMAENILEIYLLNSTSQEIIPYHDKRLYDAHEKLAREGDTIIISFIPRVCNNVMIKMVMDDIVSYSGSPTKYENKINSLGSAQIAITTGGETPYHKPMAKYHISQPWVEFISVDANNVYISEAEYIKND